VPDDTDQDRTIRSYFDWIEYARGGFQPGPRSGELADAFQEVAVDMARDDPEVLWPIIVRMVAEAPDEHHLGSIGAAPLENLLWFHGPEFVDRIEAAALADTRFRRALNYVDGWDTSITASVTERLRPYLASN
jgi:hypothetical protein